MRYFFLLGLIVMANQSVAMQVTNLDNVAHRVGLSRFGEEEVSVIAPNETEIFAGASYGSLSLLTAQNPKPSRGNIHADGLLSGIIGNERTENIPVGPYDNFVIWPGGKMTLQSHRRKSGRH